MKKLFVASMAALMCVTLGGCSTTNTAKDGEVVELKYWYAWQDKIAENNKEKVEEFNNTIGKENGVHITAEYQGTYVDLHSKLQSAFVANEEPAVSVMEIASIKTFADGGMLAPIDSFIAQADIDDFYPGLMENSYVNEQLYGVPYLRSTPVLYYNKTLFEQAGLDSSKAPETWEEVIAASTKLAEIGVSGYGFVSDAWPYEAYIQSAGGSMLSTDETKATFQEAAGIKMAQYFQDGVTKNNFAFYNSSDDLKTAMMNQKVAMFAASTADLTQNLAVASENGYEINTGFIPMDTQRNVPTGGCNLVMTSKLDDQQKEAAALFINYMIAPETALSSHLKTGYLPTRQSLKDNQELKDAYTKTPQYQTALDQLQYGHGRPMNAGYKEVQKIYNDAMTSIVSDGADVTSTLQAAATKADPILAGK